MSWLYWGLTLQFGVLAAFLGLALVIPDVDPGWVLLGWGVASSIYAFVQLRKDDLS